MNAEKKGEKSAKTAPHDPGRIPKRLSLHL
jgi:hypothetical protein